MTDSARGGLSSYAAHWGLVLEHDVICTPRATIAFGHQGGAAVAVKVMNFAGDKLQSAAALLYYAGYGAVRCLDQFGNALLLERIVPGKSLTECVLGGYDDWAMRILCSVIRKLHAAKGPPPRYPAVELWGASFANYRTQPQHPALPLALVEQAETMCLTLPFIKTPRISAWRSSPR
jgi:streptomycin 6-kinase